MMILPFSARLRGTLFTLTLTLLSGCALIQDEPAQVAIVNPQQAQLAQVIHLANSDWPAARWWEAYDDPQLNMLINRALQNSPTMQAARLRISQSQSTVELARSAMGLQATAVAAQNRLRITDKSFSWPDFTYLPVDKNGPWYTLNTVGVGAQLNIDLWGADPRPGRRRYWREKRPAGGDRRHSLDIASSVAAQALHRHAGDVPENRAAAGAGGHCPILGGSPRAPDPARPGRQCGCGQRPAAEQLAARQQIISAEGMLTQYRETLRALIGADAQSMPAIHPVALPALQETLPPSLSFELLARRPDLQALRGYVTASLSQVDAAKAAFYPHFDIKAFWGYNALSVGDLFKSSFQQINLLPGLYLPIFDGGRLNANLQSVRTASNILIKQYNQAVLDAFAMSPSVPASLTT